MIKKWNEILLCTTAISHRIHSGAVLLRSGVSFKLASLITMHAEWLVGCFQPLPSSEQSWQAAFGAPVLPQAVCVCVCLAPRASCQPRAVAQGRDTGSAQAFWGSAAGHTPLLQHWGSWAGWPPAPAIYLGLCDLQLHYKQLLHNRCTKLSGVWKMTFICRDSQWDEMRLF